MNDTPGLDREQRLFWKLIVAPEGAASGVESLDDAAREQADALVRERAGMTATERLDIYANMYFFRILGVLQGDFPVLHALLGNDGFHNLITDYLIAHPPRHWSLRWVGEQLPGFVRGHEVASMASHVADVAALEWALHDAFDAKDVSSLQAEALSVLTPEEWPDLVLRLDPAVRLLKLTTPASVIWQQVKTGLEVEATASGDFFARVWRREMGVFHKSITATEYCALLAVSDGLPFAEVCERVGGDDADPQQVAAEVVALIRTWLAEGVLAEAARD